MTYLLGPQISSHLSRHDMTCLSGPQISSHLSRFISDNPPPKIESFVAKIVATNIPRASPKWLTHMEESNPHRSRPFGRGTATVRVGNCQAMLPSGWVGAAVKHAPWSPCTLCRNDVAAALPVVSMEAVMCTALPPHARLLGAR